MTPAARRYAPHLIVVGTLALLPVLMHGYLRYDVDDCAHPSVIASMDVQIAGQPDRVARMFDRFEPYQWREGLVHRPDGGPMMRYTIARSFDAKRLYYRPELQLVRGLEPDARGVETIDVDGQRLPIHRAYYESTRLRKARAVVAYLLLYDGRPVENPYRAQLAASAGQLVSGRRPMTLLFVWGLGLDDELDPMETRAHEWLVEQWNAYQVACTP